MIALALRRHHSKIVRRVYTPAQKLDLDREMTLYNCSKNSLKLRYYTKVPYFIAFPLGGMSLYNLFGLF